MFQRIRVGLAACLALFFISSASLAGGLAPYNQDFNSLNIAGTEIGDGWTFFVNVFDDDGATYLFGYGGAAPNGPQICALVDDQGGVDQAPQQLSVYSDYNCCNGPPPSGHQDANGLVETNVYQEQTIAGSNVGETWTFTFEAKLGNLSGASTATAFIKVLDPDDDFSVTAEFTEDMTTTSTEWAGYEIDALIGDWTGQVLQFGFQTTAAGFEDSGVYYDNVTFGGGVAPPAEPFADDFESYDDQDPDALGNGGWLVFGNVRSPTGTFLYGYGPEPAPNQSGAFSGVSVGEGGPAQGNQQLNTFSDYNNIADHNAGNLIESIVYQEQTLQAANVGQTWVFTFDAKLNDLAPPTTGKAFIKTIDPLNNFATTNDIVQFTTTTPTTWTSYELSLEIDAGLVGQLIQIGFSNTATNFNDSSIFYDNVNFDIQTAVDTDGDGLTDDVDNCTLVFNAGQADADGDGHGNICDADFDQNCFTTFPDLSSMQAAFFTISPLHDLNNTGGPVNFADLGIMQGLFFSAPGPSAPGALCN